MNWQLISIYQLYVKESILQKDQGSFEYRAYDAPHPQYVFRIEKIEPLLSLTKDQLERKIQEFLSVLGCRLALHRSAPLCPTLKLSNPSMVALTLLFFYQFHT